ncbi:hypothetical protein OHS17_18715 [Streptomyces sp. NBC_00523]|uniref:hypothetical protein n=1 Tax=Streptomyces sp. NBC_00523 TaxID=2975765 RepID=UPI002E80F283|nr:hypothetical protein [Streptomyces sp. NBC_00523]WUD01541.1 hypothetical protein OHS17_18715 [Streptomyces sp. NBC_00523]
MSDGLYIEARIGVDLDLVWERTQDPAQHQRWDLRFTRIAYLPGAEGEPQRFTYGVRVLPGFFVSGTGISAGERHRPDGTRTSALRFACAHPLSFLTEGRGYWRYVPCAEGGLRFLTGYDYAPRWGRLADRLLFRPLMGWATAWSFDRLRLWCERGITPERALWRSLGEVAARLLVVAAAAWAAPLAAVPVLVAAVPVLLAALLLPPLPGTPAARRCLRRPPGRGPASATATPPALLDRLEHP